MSVASLETKGKNVYRAMSSCNLTCIGHTQPQGNPDVVYVIGSVHVIAVQSANSVKTFTIKKVRFYLDKWKYIPKE